MWGRESESKRKEKELREEEEKGEEKRVKGCRGGRGRRMG